MVWDAADTGREMCLHPHRDLRDNEEFYEYKISNTLIFYSVTFLGYH